MQSLQSTIFQYLQTKLLQEHIPKDVKEHIKICYTLESLLNIVKPWPEMYRRLLLQIKPLTPEIAYYVVTFIQKDMERVEKEMNDW